MAYTFMALLIGIVGFTVTALKCNKAYNRHDILGMLLHIALLIMWATQLTITSIWAKIFM